MLPIAMLALTYSSLPIHRDYFKTNTPTSKKLYNQSLIFLFILPACCIVAILLTLQYSLASVIVCISIFIAEKCFDEKLRFLNYYKKMKRWEITQLIRSIWLIPGLVIAINYENNYELISSAYVASTVLVGLFIFRRKVSLFMRKNFQIDNLYHLYRSLPYLGAGLTVGTFRQLPKIVVTQYFEKYAHFFLIVAQATQVIPIIYNLFYQVPYRKLMSIKPKLYSRVMLQKNSKLCRFAFLLIIISLLLNIESSVRPEILIILIAISDAVFFSVITNYTSNVSWILDRAKILLYSVKYLILVSSTQLIAIYIVLQLNRSDIALYVIALSIVTIIIVQIIQYDLKKMLACREID